MPDTDFSQLTVEELSRVARRVINDIQSRGYATPDQINVVKELLKRASDPQTPMGVRAQLAQVIFPLTQLIGFMPTEMANVIGSILNAGGEEGQVPTTQFLRTQLGVGRQFAQQTGLVPKELVSGNVAQRITERGASQHAAMGIVQPLLELARTQAQLTGSTSGFSDVERVLKTLQEKGGGTVTGPLASTAAGVIGESSRTTGLFPVGTPSGQIIAQFLQQPGAGVTGAGIGSGTPTSAFKDFVNAMGALIAGLLGLGVPPEEIPNVLTGQFWTSRA